MRSPFWWIASLASIFMLLAFQNDVKNFGLPIALQSVAIGATFGLILGILYGRIRGVF
ncbi:hypothetical protein HY086_02645 [Candidatus Gottesmanbacteria bacterium]|nr:hypothetical protein [Candidatus Gottesmanbacteria bacterium]